MVSAPLPGLAGCGGSAGPHSEKSDRMMDDVLNGWQAISQYLRVSEKTALRYRKFKSLPVTYNEAGRVASTKQELDEWRFGAMPEHCQKEDR
jgi:hypothetical protein